MLVYDQDALAIHDGGRVFEQELQPAFVELLGVPPGLGEVPLQALGLLALGSGHGLCVGKGGKGLVMLGRKQQSL